MGDMGEPESVSGLSHFALGSGVDGGERTEAPSLSGDISSVALMESFRLRQEYLYIPHLSSRDLYARVLFQGETGR